MSAGLVKLPSFDGASVITPSAVGVIVKVCGEEELANVRRTGLIPNPVVGVIVIVPVKRPFGVTVNAVEVAPTSPKIGPVTVYAFAFGVVAR